MTSYKSSTEQMLELIDKKTSKETYLLAQENRILKPKQTNEAKPGGLAVGRDPSSVKGSGGGGGITSPLTESAVKPRTYFTERLYTDSAGLLCYIVKPLQDIYFNTADTSPKEVKFTLEEPPTPP